MRLVNTESISDGNGNNSFRDEDMRNRSPPAAAASATALFVEFVLELHKTRHVPEMNSFKTDKARPK